MSQFVEEGHLGGYVRGGDPATFYPELWTWLVEEYQVRSVVDVGCGEGYALRFFREQDCYVRGVDGVFQRGLPNFVCHDYTTGAYEPWPWADGKLFDLCWSCEFVEHVEKRYVGNFLATFARAEMVLMTHAEPGQLGYHHVNCRSVDYWKGALAAIGYEFDAVLTAATRELARANTDPNNHYVRSGLAFKRYE